MIWPMMGCISHPIQLNFDVILRGHSQAPDIWMTTTLDIALLACSRGREYGYSTVHMVSTGQGWW